MTCTNRSQYDAEFRQQRKEKKLHYVALYNAVVAHHRKKDKNFKIGFTCRRMSRAGKVYDLPAEFAYVLKACEEFIENPRRFESLWVWGGEAINNIQSRRLIAKVLACMIPNSDLKGGRIGTPTESGIKPISYDALQEEYALRFGEYISPKSFAKAIRYLKTANYLKSDQVNFSIEDDSTRSKIIRSAAAYKQFTLLFFKDLKVTFYKNVSEMIIETRKRRMKKNEQFKWVDFAIIRNTLFKISNAIKLNRLADSVTAVFYEKFQTH